MRRIVWWWSVVVCYGGWGQLPSKSDGLLAPCGFHSHPRLCPYFAHTIVRYTTELAFRHDGCGGEVLVLRTLLHLGSPWSRVTKSTSKPGGPGDSSVGPVRAPVSFRRLRNNNKTFHRILAPCSGGRRGLRRWTTRIPRLQGSPDRARR